MSSECLQSCEPTDERGHLRRLVSLPLHVTSSNSIGTSDEAVPNMLEMEVTAKAKNNAAVLRDICYYSTHVQRSTIALSEDVILLR